MAMPFFGDEPELQALKTLTFQKGAKAFKHKELNYYKWEDVENISFTDLLDDKLKRTGTKRDNYNQNIITKSGELILLSGKPQLIPAEMPMVRRRGEKFENWSVVSKMNERLVLRDMPIIDCGYSLINNENWKYIR